MSANSETPKEMDWKAQGKIFSSLNIADGKMFYIAF